MDIRDGTGLAATITDEAIIRVYTQDISGVIHEGIFQESSGWSNGTRLFQAKLGTPIAVAVAVDALRVIHIYYLTRSNSLNELIFDTGEWTRGDLGSYGFNVSPSTDICAQMRNQMILVYAQLADNTIQEYTYNESKWSQTRNFGLALFKTGIAVIGDELTRLYYQSVTGDLIEKINRNSEWEDGTFNYIDARPGTSITAVSWNDCTLVFHIRRGNYLVQSLGAEGGWTHTCLGKPVLGWSRLASLSSNSTIKIYLQDEEGRNSITEIIYENKSWRTMPSILPVLETPGVLND